MPVKMTTFAVFTWSSLCMREYKSYIIVIVHYTYHAIKVDVLLPYTELVEMDISLSPSFICTLQ